MTLSGQSKYHRNGDKINTNNTWHCQDNQNIIEMETKLIPTTYDTVRTIKISRNGDKINTNNIWHCQDNQNIIEMETKLIPTTYDTVRTIKIS